MEPLHSWKINISNFYPIGLKHYGNDKTTIVIAWSSNLLLTKKFRSFTKAIEQNLQPDKDQVRQINDTISQIITNKLESAILTQNEKLMWFETHKVIKNVDYLGKVKSICTAKGSFIILQLNGAGDIEIIVHPDSFPCPPHRLRTFDVSFDKNYCQSTWNDAHFNIATLHANPDRPQLFNALRKCSGERYTADDYFIFFSINNTLLSLVIDADDYHYHQVHTHSSNVRGIHSSKDFNSIYVLLESGVIDVIYSCEILGVIKTSSLYFMYDVGAYDICDDMFVYSDGFQIILGHIEYSNGTRSYKTSQKVIPLPGIVAITTVKASKTVLCLSENRMFYKVSYTNDDIIGPKSDPNMMIPVKEFLNEDQRTNMDIRELVDSYDRIKSELLTQNKMFDALALRCNYENGTSVLRYPLNAKVTIHRTIPDLSANAIYPSTAVVVDRNGCFLHIQLQPHRFGKIFSSNIWNLSIHCTTTSQTLAKVFRLIDEDFAEPVDILIPLVIKNHLVPPQVHIDLSTSVKIGSDVLCLSFPVHTNSIDYGEMIKLSNKISPHLSTGHQNSKRQLMYSIMLPKTMSLNEITGHFVPLTGNICFLSLLDSFLELSVDDTRITLKSREAAVMLHVKKLIFERLQTVFKLTMDHDRTHNVQKYVVSTKTQ